MTNPPNETPQSNRPDDALDQQISDAQRGVTSGDDLIDLLASLQPAPDADFQKRLEADLIQRVSKASANGASHIPDKPMTLTRGELKMYPEKNKNRATSRLSWIAGIAAALMLVFVGGMWIGSGANVPAFLAPQADNTPEQAPPIVVTSTPMSTAIPPTVSPPTETPMPSPTFAPTFVPTVTAPSFPPTSLDFTATPILPGGAQNVSIDGIPTGYVAVALPMSIMVNEIDLQPDVRIDIMATMLFVPVDSESNCVPDATADCQVQPDATPKVTTETPIREGVVLHIGPLNDINIPIVNTVPENDPPRQGIILLVRQEDAAVLTWLLDAEIPLTISLSEDQPQ